MYFGKLFPRLNSKPFLKGSLFKEKVSMVFYEKDCFRDKNPCLFVRLLEEYSNFKPFKT